MAPPHMTDEESMEVTDPHTDGAAPAQGVTSNSIQSDFHPILCFTQNGVLLLA